MTTQEAWKIIYVLKATYPHLYKGYTVTELDNLVNAWGMVFEDYPYEVVSQGLKVFLASDTKGFPPSPGQVMECIIKITMPESADLSEGQAWAIVMKAVERGSVYAEEDFNKFPENIKKAVGSPSYLRRLATDSEFNEGVEQSNFLRSYRTILHREREDAKIPVSVRQAISMALGQIEQKEVV